MWKIYANDEFGPLEWGPMSKLDCFFEVGNLFLSGFTNIRVVAPNGTELPSNFVTKG